jgi:alpha-mannosidase
VDYFVTQKMAWNDTNQLPFKFFWWESPDGSKVLTYFPHDYANDNLNLVRLARDFTIAQKQATGLPGIMDLYGIGDHGGGPTRAILDQGFHWALPAVPAHVTPKIQFGTAQSYFTSLEKQIAVDGPVWDYGSIAKGYTAPPAVAGKVNIPTWKSELYFEYHRGVMTTQANHKRNMREAEEQVLNAEKFSSIAWLYGSKYPAAELTEDWKKVLFNQFHDTAAGSGIGRIYKDAQKDYDVVRWSTNEIDAAALGSVAENVKTSIEEERAIPIMVFNPLGWNRSGEVTVKVQLADPKQKFRSPDLWHNGQEGGIYDPEIISRDTATGITELRLNADNVPALGYKVFWLMPPWQEKPMSGPRTPRAWSGLAPQQPVKQEEWTNYFILQNYRGLSVKVNKDNGCITSIENGWTPAENTKYEWITPGGCGNQLQAFKDTPKDYDAWNIDPGTLDQSPTMLTKADSVELVGENTWKAAVRITRTWQSSKFVQTISLSPNSDQVDIDNEIDWHESHVLLKAAFPLAAVGPFATYEIPYGTIDRPTTRNNSWEKAQFEVPAMRWADLGDGKHGLSVINESKYGYDAVGNTLRLTLLRSPKWPDAEADMGHHHFHYALYPHEGTWKDALTVRHGYEYNYPLTAVVTTAHAGSLPAQHSFASVTPENVVLTAVKKAEDAKGLIFRVYEWAGKSSTVEFHVPAGATGATVTNLMETAEILEGGPLKVEGDVVKAPIKPFEILTIRVDYPAGGAKE